MQIDKSGSLHPAESRPISSDQGPVPESLAPSRMPVPQDIVTLGPGLQKVTPYIILPPNSYKNTLSSDELQRRVFQDLRRQNVAIEDRIPLVDGFTATLDEKTKAKLEQMGYNVVLDDQTTLMPPKPWEIGGEDDLAKVPGQTSPTRYVEQRPPLSEPRFSSPLCDKYRGKGVTIAFLDTGIYPHPDFIHPNNRITAFVDFVNHRTIPYDDSGHGTHVAGDAAGNGYMSNGLYRGPAPEADIVGVKVLNKSGIGRKSTILKGLHWVLENKDRYNIKVVNVSLGVKPSANYQEDPVEQAVQKCIDAGIVIVASAGNEGPNVRTILAPGDNPRVITVGAVDDKNTPSVEDDEVPDFSGRGPTLFGLPKPDLLAPGEGIIGPNAPVTPTEERAQRFDQMNQTLQWLNSMPDEQLANVPVESLRLIGLSKESIEKFKNSPETARTEIARLIETTGRLPIINTSYVGSPGTSMATPIVSGVIAQMLEANPRLTPDEVKTILTSTATKLPIYGCNTQGAGEINPHKALEAALAYRSKETS